ISRQIWWGHRLPVYYCPDCQAQGDNENRGIIVSKTQPEVCPDCQSNRIYQDPDVLDTWFSSWLWPFATFGWPLSDDLKKNEKDLAFFYPTDCLVTASEILFFWVARMIMSGLEFQGQAPFKDVIIHGTVRDEKGVKMSKSLGNTIDPLEIIDKFGSDSLRFSLMLLCAGGADVYLSDDKFLVGRNFCNKIWNAARFLLTKIESDGIAIDNLDMSLHNPVDAWIVNKLNLTIEIVSAHLEAYRFNDSAKALYEFFWHDFCDWYIEISKDRFNENTAKILIHCLISSLKLLHPFIPFITEEIFQLIKANSKLVIEPYITTATWPVAVKIDSSAEDICRIEELIATVRQIRNIKVDTGLGLAKVKLNVSAGDHLDFWKENQSWFERLANLSQIEYKDKLQRTIYNNGSWLLNFDVESIDSQALVASLDKKVKKLSNVLATIGQRLNNQKFISLAPKETVEQEKNKYNDLNSEVSRLKELYDAFK
ncbi:MAG: class I tRNA ligase family protein, partial [Candidatus Omnitrophica bacterium]|nr:class I tRNA ligase family protein [Candidatus Omnitrophota bacterium]